MSTTAAGHLISPKGRETVQGEASVQRSTASCQRRHTSRHAADLRSPAQATEPRWCSTHRALQEDLAKPRKIRLEANAVMARTSQLIRCKAPQTGTNPADC